ncbi:hypothetical protein C8R44DRAFT_757905 [Mycena epipterygia]|nr:hypothetical protein C8R44DRAFT_757905 [Mycena epipterygia]
MPPKHHRKSTSSPRTSAKCSTLLDDEMTRCSEIPTHGSPVERCRVHHEQYRTMTKRYKDAQKFVDETLGGSLIPMKAEVLAYTSVPLILEKARLLKKCPPKQMTEAVEIRDALEARALELYKGEHPAKDWIEEFQTTPLDEEEEGLQPGDDIFTYLRSKQDKIRAQAALNEEDDLIGLKLRFEREKYLHCFQHILEPEEFWTEYFRTTGKTPHLILPRIGTAEIHSPMPCCNTLGGSSMNKVSFKDFVMDDDFGMDDVLRVHHMYQRRLKMGLRWWKDSLTEAIAIKDSSEASANMGNIQNRFKILGGWIYNNSRNTPAPNKVWWTMFSIESPEKDTENRYVRLCCNFDELHTFLTFSALMLSSIAPSFCTDSLNFDTPRHAITTRSHLSLCGVILIDLVNGSQRHKYPCPVPSVIPAKKSGCITWVELQSRSYMFGAIRNEPDEFTTTFLKELRARPDLFAVITRSDTDPPRHIESFGDVTDAMRVRQFEAPFQPVENAPAGRGPWKVMRSAMNVLYGGGDGPWDKETGYLQPEFNRTKDARGRTESSFFVHKKFPVKYFLILNASPTGHGHDLARQVAWAAFRAKGLVQGNYDERRYNKASDVLFTQHARERLAFLPDGDYSVANLASRD